MSNMEEISYWVYTKRAPCLYNYDNQIKKQFEQAQCSKPISVHSSPEKASTPKKIKRKLVILGDDSVSSEKLENLYFDASHTPKLAPPIGSNKSKSDGSDIDFNIKKSSVQHNPKRIKLQKNNKTVVHKKIKVTTSTPKVMNGVRRSLRKTHTMVNNNNLLNNSFESSDPCNKETNANQSMCNTQSKHKQIINKMDITLENKNSGGNGDAKKSVADKVKKEIKLIGQFDDVSDVSGFTVHYVKSTKVNSRNTRTLRTRVNRTVVKEAPSPPNIDKNMIVCVDKSINTDLPVNNTQKNSSTESEQNVMKLVSLESHDKSIKINKGTSVMNFMDLRVNKYRQNVSKNKLEKNKSIEQHDDSFDFKNTNGTKRRYPKRRNLQQVRESTIVTRQASKNRSAEKRADINNTSDQFNNSDVKENPEVLGTSRTRSGRNVGLTLRQSDNSVLVVNNTVDLVSSTEAINAINVASPKQVRRKTDNSNSVRKKRRETPKKRVGCLKKVLDTSVKSLERDSLREKSGFSACFSDSDDEKPLKQKFFC